MYFGSWMTKLELMALIPFDWLFLAIVLKLGLTMECANPVYAYDDGSVQSTTPLDGHKLIGIRHLYNSVYDDMAWVLEAYSLIRMMRLLRLFRSMQWAVHLQIPRLSDPICRLVKTLVFTILFSHIDGTFFWILSTHLPVRHRWINQKYVLLDEEGNVRSFGERFLRNIHAAEKALFFLPREAENFYEISYSYFEMLCASVIYGSIFGIMSSIVRSLDSSAGHDKASKQRNFKKSYLVRYMKDYKFPPTLQTKVLQQEEFDWAHKRGVDTEDLFKHLPLSIREQVNYHLYYDLISSVPIFKNHADEVIKRALCQKISIINVTANFYICKAGEHGTEMYFLRQGEIEVLTADESKILVTLGPGAFFGEVALFSNTLRTATVRTKMEVQLCVLKKKEFDEILSMHQNLVGAFKAQIETLYAADKAREDEKARKVREEAQMRSLDRKQSPKPSSLAPLVNLQRFGSLASSKIFGIDRSQARVDDGGSQPQLSSASDATAAAAATNGAPTNGDKALLAEPSPSRRASINVASLAFPKHSSSTFSPTASERQLTRQPSITSRSTTGRSLSKTPSESGGTRVPPALLESVSAGRIPEHLSDDEEFAPPTVSPGSTSPPPPRNT
ncbi:hypothetical protein BC828DRAFT_97750 [Blastocladiella britannica]|nr:hypothetical protein BC828DRAFT_97750 [Blastocladiella britannica]